MMTIQSGHHRRRSVIEFFLLEFVTVFVTLTLLQLAGRESYSPEVAGFVGGVAAVIGTGLFGGRNNVDRVLHLDLSAEISV